MPKELFEINTFESGNIYNPDDRDIPDDAAAYSENIDPYGQEGSLKAINIDGTAIKASVDTTRMSMINDDGTYSLVYVDKSDYDIKKVDDIYGSPSAIGDLEVGTFGTATSIAAQQVNNKEVHMGLGKTRDPKWVGIIPHKQFNGSVPSGLQIDDAELKSPSPFPVMHTIVNDSTNTYCYGIKLSGNYVYKFDVSAGKLVRRSEYYFVKTKAMCLASDGSLWVLDEVSSGRITVIKIDPDNMDQVSSRPIADLTGSLDAAITDMAEDDSMLWFATGNIQVDTSGSYLWNTAISNLATSSSDLTIDDRTPFLGADGTSQNANDTDFGDWVKAADNKETQPDFSLPKLPLMIPTNGTGFIGISMHVAVQSSGAAVRWYRQDYSSGAGSEYTSATWFLQIVKKDITAGDKLNNTSTKGIVFGYHIGTTDTYTNVTMIKSTASSSKLCFVVKNSAQSTVNQMATPDKTAAVTTVLSKASIDTNVDIEDAVAAEKSGSYNVFAGGGVARWGISSGSDVTPKLEAEFGLTFSSNSGVSGSLIPNNGNYYSVSFVYDGYQESPLSSWEKQSTVSGGSGVSLNVKIDIYPVGLSKRVTHINIYRSSDSSTSSTQPSGFFRLVKSIPLKSGWLITDTDTTNPDWGNYYTKTIVDTGASYSSYEARTGISEALLTTIPKYGLSAKVNNYLYIADCSHIDIDNATNYLFKSRPFNFDQFNWARDSLLLPSKPTALESFNGRLYAFSESSIYVINPDGMYIEDTLEGLGCLHQNAVKTSDIGMCFMSKNGVYLHDGRQIKDIGSKIKFANQKDVTGQMATSIINLIAFRGGGEDGSGVGYTGQIVISYDAYRKAFYLHFTENGWDDSGDGSDTYTNYTLVYTVPKDRWDSWVRLHGSGVGSELTVYGSMNGKNGEVLTSDSEHGLIEPFSPQKPTDPVSGTRMNNLTWISKKLTMGDSTVDKKFFKVEALSEDTTPAITVNTAENSTTYSALTTPVTSRHIQIKLAVTSDTSATIDAIRVVYRKLRRIKAMS